MEKHLLAEMLALAKLHSWSVVNHSLLYVLLDASNAITDFVGLQGGSK